MGREPRSGVVGDHGRHDGGVAKGDVWGSGTFADEREAFAEMAKEAEADAWRS